MWNLVLSLSLHYLDNFTILKSCVCYFLLIYFTNLVFNVFLFIIFSSEFIFFNFPTLRTLESESITPQIIGSGFINV